MRLSQFQKDSIKKSILSRYSSAWGEIVTQIIRKREYVK